MTDDSTVKPDLILTLDRDGVIRDVEPSEALEHDALEGWRGRVWSDTLPPALVDEVAKAIEATQERGQSICFRVQQRLPSGRQLAVEYTTVSFGDDAGFVAIGRDVQNVSDLQARLSDAQRAHQHDFWKLREIERRYRAVLDASSEAVSLVRASTMRVVEANVSAVRRLGLVPGSELLADLSARDRKALDAAIDLARNQGRAPNIVLHLPDGSQWGLRASLITSDDDVFYLIQMSAFQESPDIAADALGLDQILARLPEGFAVVDREGILQRANATFLDLVQIGVENAAIGQNLSRWFSHPGEDFNAVIGLVHRHGSVRMLRCRIEGELGAVTDVDVSAVGDQASSPRLFGLLVRDATLRDSRSGRGSGQLPGYDVADGLLDHGPLEETVKAAIEAVERRCITEALSKSSGNRTLAARRLGLSRQTLHVKLNKYNLDKS